MRILSLLTLVIFFSCSHQPVKEKHTQVKLSKRSSTQCVSRLDQQITYGMKLWEKNKKKTPERSGFFDVIIPSDNEQYKEMNKMAILAVSVVYKEKPSKPIGKIHFFSEKDNKKYNLPSVFPGSSIKKMPEGSRIRTLLGGYKQDLYFFVPIQFLFQKGKLLAYVDIKVPSLELTNLPFKNDFIANQKWKTQIEDPNRWPNPKLVIALLEKYYCLGQ